MKIITKIFVGSLFVLISAVLFNSSLAIASKCSEEQCNKMIKNKTECGSSVPYVCMATGGCKGSKWSRKDCDGDTCDTSKCPWQPGVLPPQRAHRTITFINKCKETLKILLTGPKGSGFNLKEIATVHHGKSVDYKMKLNEYKNSFKEKYYSFNSANFRPKPKDGDTANSTLFEITFGAYGGKSDNYDISTIPSASCASHLNTKADNFIKSGRYNSLGFADHLPKKSSKDSSWACLHLPGSGKDILDCGDGQANSTCPEVKDTDGTILTQTAMTAKKDPTTGFASNLGCGVDGETCSGGKKSCCPQVCAMKDGDNPKDTAVRNRVHKCAYYQTKKVNKKSRASGFYKSIKVEYVFPKGQSVGAGCQVRTCIGADPKKDFSAFMNMGKTCQGYLWPFDDAYADVNCAGTPDYRVTYCPES